MLAKRPKKLFEPIKIGNMELKNRIKLPAMGIAMAEDGVVTEQAKAFYAERAKGGVALIGLSCTATRLIQGPMFGIFDDRFIPGLRELVESIHANGAKVYAQMGVGYSWAFGDGPVEFVSPSGITPTGRPGAAFRLGGPLEPTMPKALSVDEIHQMVDAYVLLEIIENIKSKTGEDYPITCRLSGADLMEPKGYDLEDTKKMARMLEKAGVAEIDVMSGWHYASVPIIQTPVPQGAWVYLAEGVKSSVDIPVAAGTQIQDPMVAEWVVAEGKADMVYMARALVADPELPNKAREGRLDDIRPCMNCCRCISAVDDPPIFCSVNARMGRGAEYPSEKPAASSKSVLVVGAGPGGMEAARIASLRGHKVTLCDQNPRPGGALLLASITNRRMEPVLNYMKREIEKLPIEVKLNTQVTPALVEKMKPDVVVLALGGAASAPEVPGGGSDIVLDRGDVQAILGGHPIPKGGFLKRFVSYLGALFIRYFYRPSVIRWLLRFSFPFKKRVVVVGGNFAGCELAETLVDRGKKVTIIEESGRLGSDIEITHRWVFLDKLRKAGTKMFKEAKVTEITNKGVEISQAGSTEFIEADTVVKVGITTNTGLAQELEGRVPELHLVGDCAEPGKLMEAIASGFLAAQKI